MTRVSFLCSMKQRVILERVICIATVPTKQNIYILICTSYTCTSENIICFIFFMRAALRYNHLVYRFAKIGVSYVLTLLTNRLNFNKIFADTFHGILLRKNITISISIILQEVDGDRSPLVSIMTWHWKGTKSLYRLYNLRDYYTNA